MTMYYRAKFLVLGKTPTKESIGEAFQVDERLKVSRIEIGGTTELNLGQPPRETREQLEEEEGLEEVEFDGFLSPGWGHLFFSTQEEYEPEKIVDIVDEGIEKLKVPLELRYIDANTEAFSDK